MSQTPRVIKTINRPLSSHIENISRFPAATIHEAYGGQGALAPDIKPIHPAMKIWGPAVTVAARPGDNIIIHKAIYTAQPGDVLVVDTMGFVDAGIWGSLMSLAAMKQGLAGLVTDGAVRDADEIIDMGFPVFARGLCIKGTTKNSLGWVNHPMAFGGVHIVPGDLVAADRDGVVVVGREDLPGVIENSQQREDKEKEISRELEKGTSFLHLTSFEEKLADLGLTEE